MIKRTIGGNRLGSGKKMTADMKTYERSTHDMGYIWRSTMASGTLVPFLCEVGLPGDTFDIRLNTHLLTHPTIGPLFGTYKIQLDVFKADMRLYQGQLHNNKLGIGNDMHKVKFPLLNLKANNVPAGLTGQNIDNVQINSSSILSYLGIRGLGRNEDPEVTEVARSFNANAFLMYWDTYKNYYANKQEEIGAVIHGAVEQGERVEVAGGNIVYHDPHLDPENPLTIGVWQQGQGAWAGITLHATSYAYIYTEPNEVPNLDLLYFTGNDGEMKLADVYQTMERNEAHVGPTWQWVLTELNTGLGGKSVGYWRYAEVDDIPTTEPLVRTFPLSNIDDMRENILAHAVNSSAFIIDETSPAPYGWIASKGGENTYFKTLTQEGLGLKTYQSDLFNNWMQTEWIDGDNGVSAVTAIDTSSGEFTIDTLNLAKKVYEMLNRIALAGGTYDDWQEVTYTHGRAPRSETPVYMGGLSQELVFDEVIANSQSEDQPLGTLAGRGVKGDRNKGGNVRVSVDEACLVMGIISLTPRLDYSQGNKWDTGLKSMGDLHVPALDEIGFQDLITDKMAWWDTLIAEDGSITYNSAGKQPAWLDYMTNVNQVRGNFANENEQMWMTLNRRYEYDETVGIKDLTTYIDPMKYNNIFAETARDAQNFWAQISVDMTVRRKMSAKIMPNL